MLPADPWRSIVRRSRSAGSSGGWHVQRQVCRSRDRQPPIQLAERVRDTVRRCRPRAADPRRWPTPCSRERRATAWCPSTGATSMPSRASRWRSRKRGPYRAPGEPRSSRCRYVTTRAPTFWPISSRADTGGHRSMSSRSSVRMRKRSEFQLTAPRWVARAAAARTSTPRVYLGDTTRTMRSPAGVLVSIARSPERRACSQPSRSTRSSPWLKQVARDDVRYIVLDPGDGSG